jgi:hypothetical protein
MLCDLGVFSRLPILVSVSLFCFVEDVLSGDGKCNVTRIELT